jgi:hypothetical protein
MPKYNLDALGHEEFESLCQSLVQQITRYSSLDRGTIEECHTRKS